MSDLFKKLNTLIKAGVNDVIEEAQKATPSLPGKRLPRERLGSDIDSEVGQLRGQINRALEYEADLERKIGEVGAEVEALDRQADAAVAAGDDVNARYHVQRLQRAQQRQQMLQADLQEHRIVTQELISRVNELDATISEARYRETHSQDAPAAPDTDTPLPPADQTGVDRARDLSQQTGRVLSDVLREARERIEQMSELADAQTEVQQSTPSASDQAAQVVEQEQIDDDIAARRSRLSSPPKKPNPPDSTSTPK